MADSFDVAILGAGPGGYVGAIRAAQLGLRTALIERDKLGGTCLHVGCIPTKALLHTAETLETIRHGAEIGIQVSDAALDVAAVHRYKNRVVDTLHKGVEYLMRKHGITVIHGTGRLTAPGTVAVSRPDSSTTDVHATHVLVATGSIPRSIPGIAIDGHRILSSDHLVGLREIPRHLAILGAGAVGVEFASVFRAFGSDVTLVELLPRVLPMEDEEIGAAIEKALARRGITIHTGSRLIKAEPVEDGLRLTVAAGEREETVDADYLLVAVGRAPASAGLGLEDAGVRLERGFVVTDDHLRTAAKGIWAAGDVTGHSMLAHVASAEAILAVEAMASREVRPLRYDAVPRCTYSFPEVAAFGMSEAQAKERGHDVRVGRFPLSANSKAGILGAREGFVKVVSDNRYGEILGIHLIGPRVTELLPEGILGKNVEATVDDMVASIHAHPTLSEAVREAGLDALGRVIHL